MPGTPLTNIVFENLHRELFQKPTEIKYSPERVPSRMSRGDMPSSLEIDVAINRLRTHSAAGHDGVTPTMMKDKRFRVEIYELIREMWTIHTCYGTRD